MPNYVDIGPAVSDKKILICNGKVITPQVAMCVDNGTLQGTFSFFYIGEMKL